MAIIIETEDSYAGEEGEKKQSRSLRYTVALDYGETIITGLALVQLTAPLTLDDLNQQSVKWSIVNDSGGRVVQYEVPYSNEEPKEPQTKPGDGKFQFDTTGGREKIYYGSTVASYGYRGAAAPDFKGGINVSKNGVEGVDFIVPRFKFSVDVKIPLGKITDTYLDDLESLTGTVNNALFKIKYRGITRTFQTQELLFEGAKGGQSGTENWDLSFHFDKQKTARNISVGSGNIGTFVGPATPNDPGYRVAEKRGQDYLWIAFEEKQDTTAKANIQQPTSAHVVQIYNVADFKKLGLS